MTQLALSILLGIVIYSMFALSFVDYYKYDDKMRKTPILPENYKKIKETQRRFLKFILKGVLYMIVLSILISKVFNINYQLSNSIVLYSGALGMLTAKGIYDYKKD
jgi:putative effector of murein hydrolase